MENKVVAYLGLGSNIDDRMAFLAQAGSMLAANSKVEIVKSSKIYETEPWPKHLPEDGRPVEESGQNWHLNQVICIKASLSPQDLLEAVNDIEKEMGKVKKVEWGSRIIDIDLLLYQNDIIDSQNLEIPHRHMTDRQFVLVPLLEISPKLKDPRTGRFYQEFLDEIKDQHKVIPYL